MSALELTVLFSSFWIAIISNTFLLSWFLSFFIISVFSKSIECSCSIACFASAVDFLFVCIEYLCSYILLCKYCLVLPM
ncbi:hypothetical protein WA026_023759 [Henosepilachna vigintioctopunctata]|uniref:Uncharacterized protein n=1 Tax=Henosepilachna vigintioctopunctata TaxID=420089 RepID=A0AAW1U012_9CUCU